MSLHKLAKSAFTDLTFNQVEKSNRSDVKVIKAVVETLSFYLSEGKEVIKTA